MKRTNYPIHPDFQKWANMNPPLYKATLPAIQKLMGLLFARERSTSDVTVERKVIPPGRRADDQPLVCFHGKKIVPVKKVGINDSYLYTLAIKVN